MVLKFKRFHICAEVEGSTTWTVMSYTDSPSEYYLRYSPLDIAALQYLYGPSKSARTGNDKYTVSSSSANFIWDGAGTDLIDASAANQAATIYLTPGYWGYPAQCISKSKGGLSQAHRLSKLVCEGRRETHRLKAAVRGGWGLAGHEFGRVYPFAYSL